MIPTLRERYDVPVGYSGHEVGPRDLARRRGAGRLHGRAPHHARPRDVGLRPGRLGRAGRAQRLVRDIRVIEMALGDGIKRVYDSEIPVMQKLRRVH